MPGNSQNRTENELAEADLLLFNADWVLTCSPGMDRIRGGAVAVRGDRILAVGQTEDLRTKYSYRKKLDLSGHLLMPGLINTHTHAAMSIFRGLADDLPLKRWLEEAIFPAEAAFVNRDTVYLGTLLSALEMLKSGTTTFCDGYFFEESAVCAAHESGMRAVMGQGILDFPTPDQSGPGDSRARAEEFIASFHCIDGRVRPSLFCHAPYTCSPETLKWVKAMCREAGILFQIHLSESAWEVDEIKGRYGKRPAAHLDSLGILDELTLCAHGIWLSKEEIGILARSGASIAHCPQSNMKLGSGTPPFTALIAAGVKIGIGTDSAASNNNLNLFSEMDTAAKIHKVVEGDPLVCPATLALGMATMNAAAVIAMEKEIGSIEPGKKADIIAVDCRLPHLVPIYDPVFQVVYSANGGEVAYVWIDGAMVMDRGRVLSINEADVLAEGNRIGKRISEKLFAGRR